MFTSLDVHGPNVETRALLDSASSASFISVCSSTLLTCSNHRATVSGIAGLSHNTVCNSGPLGSPTAFETDFRWVLAEVGSLIGHILSQSTVMTISSARFESNTVHIAGYSDAWCRQNCNFPLKGWYRNLWAAVFMAVSLWTKLLSIALFIYTVIYIIGIYTQYFVILEIEGIEMERKRYSGIGVGGTKQVCIQR